MDANKFYLYPHPIAGLNFITMRIWIITDTHFNHLEKMQEYCGRPSDYERVLFESMKSIPAEDMLIHLGDICIGNDAEVHKQFIESAKCKKVLVRGNHDNKSDSWYYSHGWDFVCRRLEIKRFKKRIMFSHMPQADDGVFDFNVHGHFHNSDHRRREPALKALYCEKHVLLAMEDVGYKAQLLDKFLLPLVQSNPKTP